MEKWAAQFTYKVDTLSGGYSTFYYLIISIILSPKQWCLFTFINTKANSHFYDVIFQGTKKRRLCYNNALGNGNVFINPGLEAQYPQIQSGCETPSGRETLRRTCRRILIMTGTHYQMARHRTRQTCSDENIKQCWLRHHESVYMQWHVTTSRSSSYTPQRKLQPRKGIVRRSDNSMNNFQTIAP